MDYGLDSASPRPMMTNALYGLMFLITLACQTTVIASWPEPWRFFPLALVIGVIILHERSLVLGAIWIGFSGVVLEWRGLGDGLAIAGLAAAGVGSALALSVFAKRSFWALLGVGGGSALAYVTARFLWLGTLVAVSPYQLTLTRLFEQSLSVVIMAVFGVVIFGAYLRRFLRWSRDKFVSKGQLYDISFPQ